MSQHIDIKTEPAGPPAGLLSTEWLLTNGRGSYASSTVVGVNTRKYHGLLVAAVRPPGERAVLLAAMSEELHLGGRSFLLSCFEFDGVFHPRGDQLLAGFDCDKSAGVVRWTYRLDERWTLTRSLALAREADAVSIRYELVEQPRPTVAALQLSSDTAAGAGAGGSAATAERPPARLTIFPLLAYRHYHSNRHASGKPAVVAEAAGPLLRLADPAGLLPAMRFDLGGGAPGRATGRAAGGAGGRFIPAADWWYRFLYRAEAERGEGPWEDLFTPGRFELDFDPSGAAELQAAAEPFEPVSFAEASAGQRKHHANLLKLAGPGGLGGQPDGRRPASPAIAIEGPWADLVAAADDFVVQLPASDGAGTIASILAGFHWFADWGRDAFISLPGLLMATGRADVALGVLVRFARAIRGGLVPNRFRDDPNGKPGEPCEYNSVDAALWFVHAAFAWAAQTGEWGRFDRELLGPARSVLDAFGAGTQYNIHVDSDGLLVAGWPNSQLTWMDAMVVGVPMTPRAGKCVEVNALFGDALRLMATRLAARFDPAEAVYRDRLARWRRGFTQTFPNPHGGLYDFIDLDGHPNDAVRPNQLLAVSLPCSPLPGDLQRQVVDIATKQLLTPFGLRSLAPSEPGYRGHCAGPREQRDGAYHQGTVWAWLIGPFLEAYLRVHEFSADAKKQAQQWLAPLIEHMNRAAGLGQISEIFDGDPPHTPRGCIAQAWSVAEVLRIMAML